jgi:Zn finger protein HypA/HybF involved in hydrogenase expression
VKISLPRLHCRRCEHRWIPKQTTITMCPQCKSTLWETKRTNRQGMRPQTKGKGNAR